MATRRCHQCLGCVFSKRFYTTVIPTYDFLLDNHAITRGFIPRESRLPEVSPRCRICIVSEIYVNTTCYIEKMHPPDRWETTRARGVTPRALKACTWPSDWFKPRGFKKGYKTMAMVQLCQTSWPSWVSNEAELSNYRNYESFVILQKDVKCYFWTEPLFVFFVTP